MKISVGLFFFALSFVAMAQKSIDIHKNEYGIPVLFDFAHSVKQMQFGFTYEVTRSELNFEDLGRINDQTFNLKIIPGKDLKMEVSFPSGFFESIEVQLINKSGRSLLKRSFDSEELARFTNGKSVGKVSKFVMENLSDVVRKIVTEKEPIKICLAQSTDKMFTRLCSRNFGIVDRGNAQEIKFEVNGDANLRALVDNENAPLKNSVYATAGMPIRVFFEFLDGTVFEMINQPKPTEIIEVTQDGNAYKFFGVGALPLGAVKRARQSVYLIKDLVPFDATIGDFREYYNLTLPATSLNPILIVNGESGGLFQFKIQLNRVPKETERIHFKNGTPNATYEDNFKMYISSDKRIKFDSPEVKTILESNEFIWTTNIGKKGEFNKATLEYEKEGVKNRAYLEVYRGFSQEFSLKLTGISMPKQFVTLGEVSYNNWFEDFGTRPGSLLYQRLGFGLSFFKSLNEIPIDESGTKSSLESSNLSLKYRFTPGLWNWDETWGAILTYQQLKYESFNTPMGGLGFFWARSMPRIFDSTFNLIPFFRYPKWVDLDFTYFPASLDSKTKIKDSMVLNFHGKILWTKRIYGEAGFGYKSYYLESSDKGTEVRSMYLTVGLGLNF